MMYKKCAYECQMVTPHFWVQSVYVLQSTELLVGKVSCSMPCKYGTLTLLSAEGWCSDSCTDVLSLITIQEMQQVPELIWMW
jgi:hypothetical protein